MNVRLEDTLVAPNRRATTPEAPTPASVLQATRGAETTVWVSRHKHSLLLLYHVITTGIKLFKRSLYRLLNNCFLRCILLLISSWLSCMCVCFPADRDECALTHYCMHRCVNTQGSYYCECNAGHKLASNNHSCVGKSLKSHVYSCVSVCTTSNYKHISLQCFVILT